MKQLFDGLRQKARAVCIRDVQGLGFTARLAGCRMQLARMNLLNFRKYTEPGTQTLECL